MNKIKYKIYGFLPKTERLLSNQGVGQTVIKNWDPLVLGPAFAILRVYGLNTIKLVYSGLM